MTLCAGFRLEPLYLRKSTTTPISRCSGGRACAMTSPPLTTNVVVASATAFTLYLVFAVTLAESATDEAGAETPS